MADLNVLIADDNPIARETLGVTASELGWKVRSVESGRLAVEKVMAMLDGDQAVDVVVLDWKMPDMDGLAAAQAIRQACRGKRMPIILMATAYSREVLQAEPAAELVTEVLNKPVTPSGLYNAVARALRPQAAPPPQTQHGNRLQGLRLLVVDDSDINREVAQRIFEDEGASVALANDGKEALDWLGLHGGEVDIVLMDVQMPVMDGYEATRAIRATPALAHLPVVALTAGAFQAQQDAAREAGMSDYIAKPFDVEIAIGQLRRLAGRQSAAPAGSGPIQAAAPADLPGLAISRGLQIWRDPEVYRQYLRKFARDYGDCASTMRLAGKVVAQALAHKLRGAAGNLALDEVSSRAADVESRLQAGNDAGPALDALRIALAGRWTPSPLRARLRGRRRRGRAADGRRPAGCLAAPGGAGLQPGRSGRSGAGAGATGRLAQRRADGAAARRGGKLRFPRRGSRRASPGRNAGVFRGKVKHAALPSLARRRRRTAKPRGDAPGAGPAISVGVRAQRRRGAGRHRQA
ncbi:Sensory/regulatory protein RpfC [Chromobacterium violaceum]|uniref:Sensory/regulatory protein RpfC n=1 Tax=Chromobacterium violaceum TaxID=536 RepID=A0A447T8S4_CHRVL|nr:Sensory/regulatory protein RpfC [Chromobacterium violaceum]